MDYCWVSKQAANDTAQLRNIEDIARNIVINTVNLAKERIGIRQALEELARTASFACTQNRLSMKSVVQPIPITGVKFIIDAIEGYWHLGHVFKYTVKYKGNTNDELSKYYYFEAIFSQPRTTYPIPQASGSVYFRIEDWPTDEKRAPLMFFRVEGHHTDHDARHVALISDWIIGLIQMKMLFYQRLEALKCF